MTPYLNIAAIAMSMTTLFGLLFHDMHIDKATYLAIGIPVVSASVAGTAAADAALKQGHSHVHVHETKAPQRHSVRTMPTMQTPRDEHRKNTGKKVQLHFGADNGILWPSV